ncbi:metalloregulator ArsR/SmtB family transcription factor [Leuconostocaceae bacterium ESL0958]|nr:metalloregulator ArsR/SmtB family transcription factor [Leuconostocaceae bacterium ESL0958]
MTNELSHIFKLLGSPIRLRILTLLQQGPWSVSDLAVALEMEQSALSHQLRLLRLEQVVTVEKDGRTVYYQLTDSHILQLLGNAEAHVRHVLRNQSHQEALAAEQVGSVRKKFKK